VVVHTARLANIGDLVTSVLLALSSAALCLAVTPGAPVLPLLAAVAACGGLLGFGWRSLRAAQRPAASTTKVRVAAVVADGPPPPDGEPNGMWPTVSPDYRDVPGTIARYQPLIERAASEGARILILPEVSVYLEQDTRRRWLEAVQAWARTHDVVIVAPYFNADLPRNELVVVDRRGVVADYEKQYPARNIEPARRQRLQVGPHHVLAGEAGYALSTAICVDLDYGATARSARRAGALLCVPSNDWFDGFHVAHHRTAVWGAVMAGVPVVRATGHGISAIFDRAGRVLAQQSSEHGPVVLVADVEAPATA
jgi:predicted amidohydrolase